MQTLIQREIEVFALRLPCPRNDISMTGLRGAHSCSTAPGAHCSCRCSCRYRSLMDPNPRFRYVEQTTRSQAALRSPCYIPLPGVIPDYGTVCPESPRSLNPSFVLADCGKRSISPKKS